MLLSEPELFGLLDRGNVGRDQVVDVFPAGGPAATPGPQPFPPFAEVKTDDSLAGPITITVRQAERVEALTLASDPQFANAVVRVKWGAAGVQHLAEVDAGRGTQFTVFGSWARVEGLGQFGMEDMSTTIATGGVNISRTKLAAQATFGVAPGQAPPATRTLVVASVQNGGAALGAAATSIPQRIPAYARRAIVLTDSGYPLLQWRRLSTEIIASLASNLGASTGLVLAPSAVYFALNNNTGAAIAELRVVFELAF